MMSIDHAISRTLSAVAGLLLAGATWAQATPPATGASAQAAPTTEFVDGIAAVVNKEVITLRQLAHETARAKANLAQQDIPLPEDEVIRRQILQRMITDKLLDQEVKRLDIKVTDEQVAMATQSIAQRNNLTVEQLRSEIEKTGASWDDYQAGLKHEIRNEQLRHRVVDPQIMISDAEVDAFLKSQNRGNRLSSLGQQQQAAEPQLLGLAQILVVVPEGASPTQVAQLRSKAQGLLQQVRSGADFAALAASSSDGPEALSGGDMGVRPAEGWPDLFLDAVRQVSEGGVSDIIQSGNGFHILKVVSRPATTPAQPVAQQPAGPQGMEPIPDGPVMVTQTHARHILLKSSPAMNEERATERLNQLRHRIEMGESFEDLARRYSEDPSAPQGGDLGWVSPGDMVPPFEQAMDAVQAGQVSGVVALPFGWHLIKVEERRTKDMQDDYRRMQARQLLFQRRAEPAFDEWLSQLRGQAYIDNRLDPERRQSAS